MENPTTFKDFLIQEVYMIGSTLIWTIIGILMMFGAYKFFEKITPFDDWEELQKGNVAVAVFFAGVFVGLSIIIAMVIK